MLIFLIKKIFRNIIFYPYNLCKKFFLILKIEINEYRNPLKKRYNSLKNSYKSCNLKYERDYYITYLNKKLLSLGFEKYEETNGMYSEHLIIFTAIAKSNNNIRNILEIGTHNGKTAIILSELFPLANITTIDLKDNDPIFRETYNRNKDLNSFIKNRNTLLSKYKNINFLQINSLELSTKKNTLPEQDLIWVDGAHGYPIVSCDITNAISLMHKKSILMCDDIWEKTKKNDDMYQSIAGFKTLKLFENAKIIKTYLFRKRISKLFNGNYKYVSFSKLIN
mgnify:CR=1 FL=1|tara:strand:- start:315 stop:1154 length:840 start_codon:yes stop_codon:yes gene_type:complete